MKIELKGELKKGYRMSSGSKTLRFYVNNKRVSTAVRVADGYILQVYPMRQRFADEEDWCSFWENHSVAKPTCRVEGLVSNELTIAAKEVDPSFRCPECLLGPDIDHRNCIVLKFKGNLEEWKTAGLHQKDPSPPAPSPALPNKKKPWSCPVCFLGPGNDHRMCICVGFNYSVDRWEEACGIRK